MKSKKGVFFIVDITFAFVILTIGVVLVLSSFLTTENINQATFQVLDTLSQFTSITVSESTSQTLLGLRFSDTITSDDLDKTILQMLYELQESDLNFTDEVENIVEDIAGVISPLYSVRVDIDNTVVYERDTDKRIEDASFVLTRRDFTLFVEDDSLKIVFIEVTVW